MGRGRKPKREQPFKGHTLAQDLETLRLDSRQGVLSAFQLVRSVGEKWPALSDADLRLQGWSDSQTEAFGRLYTYFTASSPGNNGPPVSPGDHLQNPSIIHVEPF